MFNNLQLFSSDLRPASIEVATGDVNSNLTALGIGTVKIISNNKILTFKNCLYVPRLKCNLISLLELFKEKLTVNQKNNTFKLVSQGKKILRGNIINKLMTSTYSVPTSLLTSSDKTPWHNRLGHPGPAVLKLLGISTEKNNFLICEVNKSHKQSLNNHFEPGLNVLDCIHMDVVGPVTPPLVSRNQYFLTIVDQASSFKMNKTLKCLVTGRGGEFVNHNFRKLADDCGYVHIMAPPETPQHNGFAERANRTILEKSRCLMSQANLPKHYWAEAVSTAVLLSNLSPTASRKNQSPHFLWTNTLPKLKQLRIFACRAVIHNLKRQYKGKMEPHRQPGILIGYDNNNTAYCIVQLSNSKVARRTNVLLTTVNGAPDTYIKARKSKNNSLWQEAINNKLTKLETLRVWDIVELQDNYKIVGTTWLFKIKRNELNKPIKYKARLCAQGFTQSLGIDVDKIYAPTGRLNSLRTLIAFACINNLQFHQINIKCAFLNAPLKETLYLAIPQGLNLEKQKYCLPLNKEIYGLHQAPLAWYKILKNWLIKVSFSTCVLDPCVFHRLGEHPIWLYVHVDDITIFGSNTEVFKEEIGKEFEIKDIGPANLMLGVKIHHTEDGISLDKQHFTKALLEQYGMNACKTVVTPLTPNKHLGPAKTEEVSSFMKLQTNYRSAIGSINYLSTATRPDLSFSTRKQPSVSISTAEAEYKLLCNLTSELLWFKKWCEEARLAKLESPILIYKDNQACIKPANGDCNLNNKRLKHVDIKLHFIKEVIKNKVVCLRYIPSAQMLADFLTKSVSRDNLEKSLQSLSVLQLGERGDVKKPPEWVYVSTVSLPVQKH
ncbi:hypothetical protein O181_043885 [Austropuccinia psidii MF-1]|uniref:Integrase catalytic domain-containing protein n=1 Tax=Austropuccinia psidii MF-1 TaxID=1389203 RepID=A0A9Q3DNG5_9BASI|nr:hypothetical protein [Austropuccinia psidii MF-1]